ncbi:MAG: acyl-ACP--UDP-N-acetylglucosamine O-acyltransferase, partial [Bdellovibrionales bacterium]|nr:acyl-ACP--UDP-N-acetylglucosamine O-acyltransferase [Bdellovibrionales bacterium]
TIAQGNYAVSRSTNKIGLKRAGLSSAAIENIHNAIRILIKGSATIKEGLSRIEEECQKDEHIQYLVDFVKSSERGVAK